jgi:hypothetical protein
MGVGSLRDSEPLSELLLRETCLFSQRAETLTERSAIPSGWSAGFHERW